MYGLLSGIQRSGRRQPSPLNGENPDSSALLLLASMLEPFIKTLDSFPANSNDTGGSGAKSIAKLITGLGDLGLIPQLNANRIPSAAAMGSKRPYPPSPPEITSMDGASGIPDDARNYGDALEPSGIMSMSGGSHHGSGTDGFFIRQSQGGRKLMIELFRLGLNPFNRRHDMQGGGRRALHGQQLATDQSLAAVSTQLVHRTRGDGGIPNSKPSQPFFSLSLQGGSTLPTNSDDSSADSALVQDLTNGQPRPTNSNSNPVIVSGMPPRTGPNAAGGSPPTLNSILDYLQGGNRRGGTTCCVCTP